MASLIKLRWQGTGLTGTPRRDRRSCEYEAYIPDTLSDRPISLDGAVAADVADAEAAIARLNADAKTLASTEVLARLLLRAESVASSRIEGLQLSGRRLLRAELEQELGSPSRDMTAMEVLANVAAMRWSVEAIAEGTEVSTGLLLEIHRILLKDTRLEAHAGRLRTQQNWIGGSDYNPCSATYVPPPWEEVERLLNDLAAFCSRDDLPAVAQAALAHAQFETIHPFVDGNGRTGRALIHAVLRRRGLAARVLPPVSLIIATWARDYISGLEATRYVGPPDARQAQDGMNRWIGFFAAACKRAVDDAMAFEARTLEIQAAWRLRLGDIRANSALDLLVGALPGAPLLTVSGAASLIQRSFQAANIAVQRLEEAGIVDQVNLGRRNRAFEARGIIDAFTDLERQLASPEGDTQTSLPSRMVPPRRASQA